MDSLENVGFPAIDDSVQVDKVAMRVVLRDASDFNHYICDSVAHRGESDHAVAVLRPFLELPLHFNSFGFFKGNVLSNDSTSEQHVLASFFLLRDSLTLGHLTEGHLVGHGVVDNMFRHIPGNRDLSSLWHD